VDGPSIRREGLGSLISASAKERVSGFLRTSVATSTAEQYRPDWELWLAFHLSNGSNDPYLKTIEGDDTARAVVWALFVLDLYSIGRRAQQVTGVLSGVRHYLLAGLVSVQFLTHAVVQSARKACRRTPTEQRAFLEVQKMDSFLPVTIDMLDNLRAFLWIDDDWGFDAILRKAVWIACCLSFDRGPRISNLTLPSSSKAMDHNIRSQSVSFVVSGGHLLRTITAGPALVGIAVDAVRSVTLSFPTSKTTGSQKPTKSGSAVITRSCRQSGQLLEDLVAFVQRSGAGGEQPLLSFYRTSPVTNHCALKVLTRKEVNVEIKAGAVRCGLPPHFFSATSLRKGNATTTSLAGFTAEERNSAGGWAPGSRVPDVHYDQSKRISGALDAGAREGGRTLDVEQVRLMIPHSETGVPFGRPRRDGGKGSRLQQAELTHFPGPR
jgi:hypothetical protein